MRHQRALPWRRTYDPYHVWVSEVMLQQTRMEVVLPRYDDFLRRFPTLHALASASEHDVTAAWSGLGYYRRARMLRTGAIAVVARFGGVLPRTVDELRTIDGIGRYTAGAIASIAYNRQAPIVDGNIARIVSRLFATHRDAWPFATALVNDSKRPRIFNQALMEIGALICKPRDPQCGRCPLRSECAAFQKDAVARFPRVVKKRTTAVTLPLRIVRDATGRVRFEQKDGLFVLPTSTDGTPVGSFRHTITTRRIKFEVFLSTVVNRQPSTGSWIHPTALAKTPHPSYVRKALQLAGII